MSQLALVTAEGVPVSIEKRSEVETKEPTLAEIAMKEAKKQSTTGKETK